MAEAQLEREAESVLRDILEQFSDVRLHSKSTRQSLDEGCDAILEAVSGKVKFRFYVQVKSRVTPQTALSACEQFRDLPEGSIPVLYAPTISPRVAEVVRRRGIGYLDRAGNCWLRSNHNHLLVERQGFQTAREPTPAAADPFSSKSSRIVRALLSRPTDGWQVRQLADHVDVEVSPGLVVKVKRALVEEGYAFERERLLYLRDPMGLLTAWSQKYSGPVEQVSLYVRGDAAAAEQAIGQWCRENHLRYALASFSAAWRLAPEVRYNVATVYLEDRGFDDELLGRLATNYTAKRVDTGANMVLWRPFDRSVFAGTTNVGQPEQPVTSALQTYLDVKRAAGRGEDAANALFDKYLSSSFHTAAEREEKGQRGTV